MEATGRTGRYARLLIGWVVASLLGCSEDFVVARLAVDLAEPPVARRAPTPGQPQLVLWNVEFALAFQERECVGVTLTFVQVEVYEEGLGVSFGGPNTYDAAALRERGADRAPGCGSPVVLRGVMGRIGGARPIGPVKVLVRAVGLDERGNGVGVESALWSPLTVAP